MEEYKKSKSLMWIIITIIILILVIIGFIFYDNFLKVDKIINHTTTTLKESFTNYPLNNDKNILSFNLNELSSNNKVDLTKNFQNIKLMKENIEYTISCTNYSEENMESLGVGCNSFEIIINNVKLKDYISEGMYEFKHIIVKDDYLLLQVYSNISNCGYIKIYKNGEIIYTINNTTAEINLTGSSFDSIMKFNNNKLYYFIQLKETDKSYNVLKVIDFNEANINETEIERKEIQTDLGAICYDYSNFG